MKKNRTENFLVTLSVFFILILFSSLPVFGEPKLTKESIPPEITGDMRHQTEMLFSKNPVDRIQGAITLGKMGRRAGAASPYLISLFDDTETGTGNAASKFGHAT